MAALLESVLLPAWLVRGLGLAALGLAALLPWAASWLGLFEREVPEVAQTAAVALRPELVWLPGGRFLMGSPEGEVGREEDEVQHPVQVAAFAMCRTEVTQGQWAAVMGENPSDCAYGCEPNLPVQDVSWDDIIGFLNRLSAREGLSPCYGGAGADSVTWDRGCTGYRLPTEAEWEYAARAGTTTAWSFGDDASSTCAYANLADQTAKAKYPDWTVADCTDGYANLAPVGSFSPSPWGLSDMHGNVWEWVWDWYGDTYVNNDVAKHGQDDDKFRVLRGGSFGVTPGSLRSSDRDWVGPAVRAWNVGFRSARSARPNIDPLNP